MGFGERGEKYAVIGATRTTTTAGGGNEEDRESFYYTEAQCREDIAVEIFAFLV